jgi:hypothetical protein
MARGKLVADGSDADPQKAGGFRVGVFLEGDAADDLPVEGGVALEAALDVEDEGQSVFEGANTATRDPAAAYGLFQQVGQAAHLGIEAAAEQVFGVPATFHSYREGEVSLYGARVGSRMVVRQRSFRGSGWCCAPAGRE